jgi:HEAT repeat protein
VGQIGAAIRLVGGGASPKARHHNAFHVSNDRHQASFAKYRSPGETAPPNAEDMPDSKEFLNALAHLVWLLSQDEEEVEAMKSALKRATLAGQAEASRVDFPELSRHLAKEGMRQPAAEELPWLERLAQRLPAHSVSRIDFQAGVRPADILGVARALAAEPVRGDEGLAFDARIVQLASPSITVSFSRGAFVRNATPAAVPAFTRPAQTPPRGSDSVATPPSALAVTEFRVAPPRDERRRDDSRQMMETAIMRHAHARTLDDLFIRLRGPLSKETAGPLVEELCRAAADYASEGVWIGVLDVIERLTERENATADPELRRVFAIQYRWLSKAATLRGVAQLLPHRKEARDLIHEFLRRMAEPAADALIDLLIASDKATERSAYRSALMECPSAVKPLIHLLGDHRWFVVRNAAELLGEMRVEEAVERLTDVLGHVDKRCRRAATHALGRVGGKRAMHAVGQRLVDPDPGVRLQAALGMGAARNPRAVPLLLEALDKEDEPDVQAALIAALGRSPSAEAMKRLCQEASPGSLLSRRPQARRLAAVQALGDAATHDARSALRKLMTDRDGEVRELAERLLRADAHEAVAAR